MAYKISDDCVACGACASTCPVEAIKKSYENGVTDEFIVPTVIDKEGRKAWTNPIFLK